MLSSSFSFSIFTIIFLYHWVYVCVCVCCSMLMSRVQHLVQLWQNFLFVVFFYIFFVVLIELHFARNLLNIDWWSSSWSEQRKSHNKWDFHFVVCARFCFCTFVWNSKRKISLGKFSNKEKYKTKEIKWMWKRRTRKKSMEQIIDIFIWLLLSFGIKHSLKMKCRISSFFFYKILFTMPSWPTAISKYTPT